MIPADCCRSPKHNMTNVFLPSVVVHQIEKTSWVKSLKIDIKDKSLYCFVCFTTLLVRWKQNITMFAIIRRNI